MLVIHHSIAFKTKKPRNLRRHSTASEKYRNSEIKKEKNKINLCGREDLTKT